MMCMVERVDAPAEPNSLSRTDTFTGQVLLLELVVCQTQKESLRAKGGPSHHSSSCDAAINLQPWQVGSCNIPATVRSTLVLLSASDDSRPFRQGVPTKFMAYIVDLTHVLEILFSLTAEMRTKKLTRTAIKMAYKAYLESEWMTHVHMDIRFFQCPTMARDVVFDKTTSMTMILSGDREVRVSRALERIPSVDLARDEEWASEVS
ncbi:hypothetical protein F5J12DRAFT_554247 [Pisolithus orientalis]|uniref:uncharacterized protein n=1 Tax=Pisolithus orientalis TaxID=936130 RepID=UPI0022254D33|nr:uncharacterized protein F5J12DRAFT_554247 [Pisolithus orientalis]KAI5987753.1 hypothetical protein F5J12DRAFT_554247 [Pisolithus orientalis]